MTDVTDVTGVNVHITGLVLGADGICQGLKCRSALRICAGPCWSVLVPCGPCGPCWSVRSVRIRVCRADPCGSVRVCAVRAVHTATTNK